MKRAWRGALSVVVTLTTLFAGGAIDGHVQAARPPDVSGLPRSPVGADSGTSDSRGWESVLECVFQPGGGVLTAQFMVDASRSLETSDPDGLRADLLRYWITILLQMSNRGADVRMSIATYGTTWTPVLEWADLGPDLLKEIDMVISSLPTDEIDTDHVGALIQAGASLQEEQVRVKESGATPCRLLLWFTDGEYDFDSGSAGYRTERGLPLTTPYSSLPVIPANETKIKSAGLQLACGQRGLVLSLRDLDTAMIAVALGNRDFRLVDELVTGDGYPDGDLSGECDLPPYTDSDFDPPTVSTDPCDVVPCADTKELPSTPLAIGMQVTATIPRQSGGVAADFKSVTVVSPGGQRVDVPVGTTETPELGGLRVQLDSLGGSTLSIDLQRVSGIGIDPGWRIEAVTGQANPRVAWTVEPYSDIVAVSVGAKQLMADAGGGLEVELRRRSGDVLDAALAELVSVEGVLSSGAVVEMGAIGGGRYSGDISPTMIGEGIDRLSVTVRLRTDEPVRLDPLSLSLQVIRPGYPWISFPDDVNGVVRPGLTETPGAIQIPYTIHPPDTGSGCVVAVASGFISDTGDLPRGTVTFVDLGDGCIETGSAALEREVVIDLTSRHRGAFCGDLVFTLSSSAKSETVQTVQQVCLSTVRKLDWWRRIIALVIILTTFFASLLVIYAMNRFRGRIPPAKRLSLAVVTIQDTPEGVKRLGGGGLLSDLDFIQSGDILTAKKLEAVSGRVRIEARFAKPYGSLFPSLLAIGPQTYIMPTGSPVLVGIGDEVIHEGPLDSPLAINHYLLDALWVVIPPASEARIGVPSRSAQLMVIRVLGLGDGITGLVRRIRSGLTASRFSTFLDGAASGEVSPVGGGDSVFL